jgi:hypothetical protein
MYAGMGLLAFGSHELHSVGFAVTCIGIALPTFCLIGYWVQFYRVTRVLTMVRAPWHRSKAYATLSAGT